MKVGILGGGQLGQMLTLAGYPLGIVTDCYESSADVPAGIVGAVTVGEVSDIERLLKWAAECDVITYESENFPVNVVERLREVVPVQPGARPLAKAQDRWNEKRTFEELTIPVAPFRLATNPDELANAIKELGTPVVVKTRSGGYDGKGQAVVRSDADIDSAMQLVAGSDVTVEGFVDFDAEVSIIGVRSASGEIAMYPLVENEHRSGILHQSHCPSRVGTDTEQQAQAFMRTLLTDLDYVGVLTLELFLVGQELFANEMAPRVHNSGHWTIEGAETSQFENHLRAIAGMPLGSTAPREFSMMHNLVGTIPQRDKVLAVPGANLHLYGKSARPGRKLGHITITAPTREVLAERTAQLEAVVE